jgi:hypothetical protein
MAAAVPVQRGAICGDEIKHFIFRQASIQKYYFDLLAVHFAEVDEHRGDELDAHPVLIEEPSRHGLQLPQVRECPAPTRRPARDGPKHRSISHRRPVVRIQLLRPWPPFEVSHRVEPDRCVPGNVSATVTRLRFGWCIDSDLVHEEIQRYGNDGVAGFVNRDPATII